MKRNVFKGLLGITVLSVATMAIGADLTDSSTQDRDPASLQNLLQNYQQAVAKKDAKALLAMYINEDASLVGGIAPRSYAVITAANKQPVPRTLMSTAKEEVAGEIKLPPDQIDNIDIHSDGEVGFIAFDYKAKIGHGRIIWTTVHTNEGWKIASAVYSINVPAADHANTK